jgi:hypothetical protein
MRNRHFPRLCRSCHVPMARQEDSCWHCGDPWVTADAPTVSPGDAPREDDSGQAARWIDEGGNSPGRPLVAGRH